MAVQNSDLRSESRRIMDEQIAAELPLPPPEFAANVQHAPVEAHLGRLRRPMAVAGIVENGMVRPLDPGVLLPEHARVIIVASEER